MQPKQLIKTTAVACLLYFICVVLAVAIDLIVFKVSNMAHTPALSALIGGGVYLGLVRKTKTFGPITALGLMMSLFFFLSGHFVWAFLPNLLCGLAADGIATWKNYQGKANLALSYAIFSLGNLAPIVTMWIAPEAYAAQLLAEGKHQVYVDKVMIPAEPAVIMGHIVGVVVAAVLSIFLFDHLSKRSKKAG